MKLSVVDRLILLDILPHQGKIITMQNIQALKNNLTFTPLEINEWGIKDTERGVTWNNKIKEIDIEITPQQEEILKTEIKNLDAEQKITLIMLDTIKKFIKE